MKSIAIYTVLLSLIIPSSAWAKLRVVTTTQDLAYLAERIGGDQVEVYSLSTGDQDLHMVEPRPSMVMKVKRADLLVKIGMDLDMWADSLIAAAKNSRVIFGAPGYVDASVGIPLLQVPKGKVDASMGDIHIFGNPHYWLDPENGKGMGKNILDGLCRLQPGSSEIFKANYEKLAAELDGRIAGWKKKLEPFKGCSIVTYHNSWVYFAQRFGLEVVGHIEPKPGIPPTPSHIEGLIKTMKTCRARAILMESYFSKQGPRRVAVDTGAEVAVVPSSVGGIPEAKTYFDLFDSITDRLAGSLAKGAVVTPSAPAALGCGEKDDACRP